MARATSAALRAALAARTVVTRDFLWISPKRRDTGAREPRGFWSDRGPASLPVVDPDTGAAVTRTFEGAGQLISISPIVMAADVTVQEVTVTMSKVAVSVTDLWRDYDNRFAPVQIFTGLFDPASRLLVEAAACRFVGEVDDVDVPLGPAGDEVSVSFTCKSAAQQLVRSNAAKSSHEQQLLRDATDDFFADAENVGEWTQFWGKETGKLDTTSKAGFRGLG